MSVGTVRAASSEWPTSSDDLVGRSEHAFEGQGPLQVAVERVIGGEADAGEHLLAVRGDGAGRASGDGLRERGGDRTRLVATRRASAASSASTATSASASRCRTAWNCAIGRPNCSRSSACSRARSSMARHAPAI